MAEELFGENTVAPSSQKLLILVVIAAAAGSAAVVAFKDTPRISAKEALPESPPHGATAPVPAEATITPAPRIPWSTEADTPRSSQKKTPASSTTPPSEKFRTESTAKETPAVQSPIFQPPAAPTKTAEKDDGFRPPRVRLAVGVGASYFRFSQKETPGNDSGRFGRLAAPNLMIGAVVAMSERSGFEFQYHDGPGQIRTAPQTQIDKKTFSYKTFSAEFQYRFLERPWGGVSALAGAQVHDVPFLAFNADGSQSLIDAELTNLSAGLKIALTNGSPFEYEGFLRSQWLLGSESPVGRGFRASSSPMFDGSLGVIRRFGGGLNVGVFWFGQSLTHKYRFDDGVEGRQDLFNSIFQIRLGYDIPGGGQP